MDLNVAIESDKHLKRRTVKDWISARDDQLRKSYSSCAKDGFLLDISRESNNTSISYKADDFSLVLTYVWHILIKIYNIINIR